ncbi:MAG: amidohydrolase, partial [Terriglobia bacterium]
RIAFLSDRDGAENLWIMQADGTEPKQLSKDKTSSFASPTWMPTGDYVIVSRVAKGLATFELWMYHVKGGRGVQITKAKRGSNPNPPRSQRHNAVGAVVSPDGNYLYYARRIGGFQYNARFPLWQIARRNMTTGVEDIITQNLGSAIRPLLSPDGEWLVYGTRYEAQTGLRLRNLETGEDRWLIYPVQRDDQEARFTRDLLPGYAFTPDGREVIVTFGGKINRVNVASGQAQVIPFSAQVKQGLGPQLNFPRRVEDGPIRARLIQKPAQSPDGQRLAFSALTRLYLMDLPEGKPRQIDTAGERAFHPAWSPDGRWIAYVTWSTEGGHIWKTRTDGSRPPQRLTTVAAFYSDPAWAPDGKRLVALRASAYDHLYSPVDFGQTPGMDLIWIPAAGGDARLVIPSRGLGSPHFTRENDRIYLYTSGNFRTGKGSGLISFRFDGTDRRTHMQVTGPGFYFSEQPVGADDMRMSPDGRWVLAYVGNQLYLAAAPQIGGGPTKVNVNSPSVPIKKLTDIGADYFEWADNGQTITWAIGSTFFRRPLDSISFEEKKDKEESKEAEEAEEVEEANESKGSEASESHPENEEEEPSPVEEIEVVVEVPRHMPAGTLVLRGARVITMKGDEVIENADIVVTDNRLAALGRRGRVRLPRGARVLDVSGMTIVPGFIDTHAHWFEIRRGVLDTQNW